MLSMFKDKKGFSVLFSNRTDEIKLSGSNTPRTHSRISGGPLPSRGRLSRCQRCGRNFQTSAEKCKSASTCLRCGYPVCEFCCEPQSQPEVRLCYVCHKSFSFMKLFGKTSYGADLVLRVMEYCDQRAERIMKSFFRTAVEQAIAGPQTNSCTLVSKKEEDPTRNSGLISKPGVISCDMSHPFTLGHTSVANRKLNFDDDLDKQRQTRRSGILNPKPQNQANQQEPLTRITTTHRDVSPIAVHHSIDGISAVHNIEEDIENSPPVSKAILCTDQKVNGRAALSNMHSCSISLSNDRKPPSEDPKRVRDFERELTFASRTISVVAEGTKPVVREEERTDPLFTIAEAVAVEGTHSSLKKNPVSMCSLGRISTGSDLGSGPVESDRSLSPAPRFPTFAQFLDEQKRTSVNRYSAECLVTVSPESEEMVVVLGAKRVSTNLKPSRATRCEVITPPLRTSGGPLSSENVLSKKKAKRRSSGLTSALSSSFQPRSSLLHVVLQPRQDSTALCPTLSDMSLCVHESAKLKSRKSDTLAVGLKSELTPVQNLHFCRQAVVSISPRLSESSTFIRRDRMSRSTPRVPRRRSFSKHDHHTNTRLQRTHSKTSKRLTRNVSVNTNLFYRTLSKNHALRQDRPFGHAHPGHLPTTRAATAKRHSPLTSRPQLHTSPLVPFSPPSRLPQGDAPVARTRLVRTHSAIPGAARPAARPLPAHKASPLKRMPSHPARVTRTRSACSPLTRTQSTRTPVQPFHRLATALPAPPPPARLVRSHSATVTRRRVGVPPRATAAAATPPAGRRRPSPLRGGPPPLTTPRPARPQRTPFATRGPLSTSPGPHPSGISPPPPKRSPFQRTLTKAAPQPFERRATRVKAVNGSPVPPSRPGSTTRVKSVAKTRLGETKGDRAVPVPALIHVPSPGKRHSGPAVRVGGGGIHPHPLPSTFFPATPRGQGSFRASHDKSTSRRGTIELRADGRCSARPLLSANSPKNHVMEGLGTPRGSERMNTHATPIPVAHKVKPKSGSNGVTEGVSQKPTTAQTVVHITKSGPTTQRAGKPIAGVR